MRSATCRPSSLSVRLLSGLAIAAGIGAVLAAPTAAEATVLTFDGTFFTPNNFIPSSYGDRVTNGGNPGDLFQYSMDCGPTPDVLVDYVSQGGSEARWKPTGYGNLDNFMWVNYPPLQTQRFLEISLVFQPQVALPPDSPQGGVYLYGFDLACELSEGAGLFVNSIEVVRTGGPLPNGVIYSANDLFIPGDNMNPTRRTITFDPPLFGQTLNIRIDMTNLLDKSNRIAIDNIKFGQGFIPSPGTGALSLVAMGMVARRRRRD